MAIPESTLNGWTTQGAVSNSKRTYRSIENALENPRYGLGEFEYEYKSHLQGSYANHTNTWGGSDVDIVVKLTEPFVGDTSDLKPAEQERYDTKYSDSDYGFDDFHHTVCKAMTRRYKRRNVERGDKAIKIKSNDETNLPIDADVVACLAYRKYNSFDEDGTEDWTEGMYFLTQAEGRSIINYSKEHRKNGSIKNDHSNERYKPTIRMFKKARDHMVKRRIISKYTTSSYFIEGLLYNVPHGRFDESNLQDSYENVLEYLESNNINDFIEQSRQYDLCVDGDPGRWTVANAKATIRGFRTLWEDDW